LVTADTPVLKRCGSFSDYSLKSKHFLESRVFRRTFGLRSGA